MAYGSLRRRLHSGVGHVTSDGTGTIDTKHGVVFIQFKLTRAFPRGAYYDVSGKAYNVPTPPSKDEPSQEGEQVA